MDELGCRVGCAAAGGARAPNVACAAIADAASGCTFSLLWPVAALGEGDALLVIDMQRDFVPQDAKANPDGGRFGVAAFFAALPAALYGAGGAAGSGAGSAGAGDGSAAAGAGSDMGAGAAEASPVALAFAAPHCAE